MRTALNNAGQSNGEIALNTIPTIEEVDYLRDYLFTDLDSFGVDPENRPSDTDDATVKKYAKAMQKGDWFFELSPFYVGISTLTIFNGEHRRKAYNIVKAKDPHFNPIVHVRFFDDTERQNEKREALNSGKKWNVDDYIEAQISGGNGDFAELKKFSLDEDHPHLHSKKGKPYYNKSAICFGSTYKDFKIGYETGDWTINKTYRRRAEQTYSEMARIRKVVFGDDVSHDFWINFGEAWKAFRFSSNHSTRIQNLPEGIETFYDALGKLGPLNSYKVGDWAKRFEDALYIAEQE